MVRMTFFSVAALLYGSMAAAQSPAASYSTSSKPTAAAPTVAEVKTPATPQQQQMIRCNAEAVTRQLKGEARDAFLKSCLNAATPARIPQDRMKICSTQAGEQKLEGDARRNFIATCLKSD